MFPRPWRDRSVLLLACSQGHGEIDLYSNRQARAVKTKTVFFCFSSSQSTLMQTPRSACLASVCSTARCVRYRSTLIFDKRKRKKEKKKKEKRQKKETPQRIMHNSSGIIKITSDCGSCRIIKTTIVCVAYSYNLTNEAGVKSSLP